MGAGRKISEPESRVAVRGEPASEREKRTRLTQELGKIDPKEERQMAEQGFGDGAWPEY